MEGAVNIINLNKKSRWGVWGGGGGTVRIFPLLEKCLLCTIMTLVECEQVICSGVKTQPSVACARVVHFP